MKNSTIRLLIILAVALFTAVNIWRYINTTVFKSRADQPKVGVSISPRQTAIKEGKTQTIQVLVYTEEKQNNISGIDLTLTAKNMEIQNITRPVPLGWADQSVYSQVIRSIGAQSSRLVYVTDRPSTSLPKAVLMQVTVKKTGTGTGSLQIDTGSSHVTGAIAGDEYGFGSIDTTAYSAQ